MKKIIFKKEVSVSARMVLLAMNFYKAEGVEPSLRLLGESVGLTIQSVSKAIKELHEKKMIAIKKEGKYNYYEIYDIA